MDYTQKISESVEQLLEAERKEKDAIRRDWLRFIRYLKEGSSKTQKDAASRINLGVRQGQRIWEAYRKKGLSWFSLPRDRGNHERLSPEQFKMLEERLKKDDIYKISQIVDWLKKELGIDYTESGINYLLARHKIKLKTGRPSNIRKKEAAIPAFKKSIRNS